MTGFKWLEEKGRKKEEREKCREVIWSSKNEGPCVDALEPSGDEGRGKLRKAVGRSTHPVIRG